MDAQGVRARLEELRHRRVDTLAVETLPIALREAAVLLLLYEQYGEAWLALTRRGPALRTHAGDVSLPGGVCEPGETAQDTALREAVEEIGTEVAEVIEVVVPELADPANHDLQTVSLGDIDYTDDIVRCSGVTIVGLTADIVIDLVHWLDGRDRRRVPERMQGLQYLVEIGRVK